MTVCRVCDSRLTRFMSFGAMPAANAFLMPEQFADEYHYYLSAAVCRHCGTFQIMEQPDAAKMFNSQYAFFSRTSVRMMSHFAEYAGWVQANYLTDVTDPFVVEIGCNDGAMLENFAKQGIRHLGIEPSANVAAEANRHGVQTKVSFFSAETARAVKAEYGLADIIMASNVISHVATIRDIAEGIADLLSHSGVFVFEEPYLGAMMEKTAYDQLYSEHVFIHSARGVQNIFRRHGLELINVMPQDTHGGSMRYVLARRGCHPVAPEVDRLVARELSLGLDKPDTYLAFKTKCEHNRDSLTKMVRSLRQKGNRIAGYAATGKSSTVLNYCGLGPDDIDYICDSTPLKQGTYSPGVHIPITSPEFFRSDYPDYAILFAWNHEAEIMKKEQDFIRSGGKWIKFIPEPRIVGA